MLGDSHLCVANKNPRLDSKHGWVQHAYNCHKYQVLSAFVRTPPRKVKNGGYGEWSSFWATLTSPALWPIAYLCLRDDKKRVTQPWLDRLTWEGIAWWYMDDGSLSGRTATFHTEGFTQEEVELLAQELCSRGLEATVLPRQSRHGSSKWYHIIALSVEATYLLAGRIAQYVLPEMAYKLALDTPLLLTCHWCAKDFAPEPGSSRVRYKRSAQRVCCGTAECNLLRRQATQRRHHEKPGVHAQTLAAQKERYHATLESSRAYKREAAARQYAANPEASRARKQRALGKQQVARQLETWQCQRCPATEARGDRRGNKKYCAVCEQLAVQESKTAYQRKHTAAQREAKATCPATYCFICEKLMPTPRRRAPISLCSTKCRQERAGLLRSITR